MALYELSDEQQQILLQIIINSNFKGDVAEKIVELKQAIQKPKVVKKEVE